MTRRARGWLCLVLAGLSFAVVCVAQEWQRALP
jgi:hypothetical protein